MLMVLKAHETHVSFPKGEADPSHISYARNVCALQFYKLLSFSLVCNFEVNLDFLFTRA